MRSNQFAHETTAAAPAAHTRYLSSPAAVTLHGETQGFVLRLPQQNKAHATVMQPLQCVSRHHMANPHLSTHMATEHDNNHATIPMRSATRDSRNTKNYAHRNNMEQPLVAEHRGPIGGTNSRMKRPQPHRPHTRGTFIFSCSHFTRRNTRFRAPASSPKQSPCNIHAASTMYFAAFPSSPLPFVTTSQSHDTPFVTTSPSHHTPFVTTSQSHHTPFVTTSLRHHFPSSPLPFVTTSLSHHCPSSPPCVIAYDPFVMYCYVMSSLTPPCHSLLFFCDVLLFDVKSDSALQQCQFFVMYCYVCQVSHRPSTMSILL